MKKYILCSGFLLTLIATATSAQSSLFPSKARIATLQQDPQWGGLRSACASGLRLQSHPVADFSPPPHYGPKGPRMERPGDAEPTLKRESIAVYNLALCYDLSKDPRYSDKAEDLLEGWARTTKKIGTAQGMDGFNFNFPYALMGAYILRHEAHWSGGDLGKFVRDIVVPANNAALKNNHGNWGVLLLATSAGYLDDPALMDQARNRWMELMRSEVATDGSLPLEICRSDTSNWCGGPTKGIKGIAYTHYALEPTTIAAEIFLNQGKSVYSTPEGALLCKAYSRAAGWTMHPETFPYYAANNGKLIGVHKVNYFYILQQRCPIPDGAAALKEFGDQGSDPWKLLAMYGRY